MKWRNEKDFFLDSRTLHSVEWIQCCALSLLPASFPKSLASNGCKYWHCCFIVYCPHLIQSIGPCESNHDDVYFLNIFYECRHYSRTIRIRKYNMQVLSSLKALLCRGWRSIGWRIGTALPAYQWAPTWTHSGTAWCHIWECCPCVRAVRVSIKDMLLLRCVVARIHTS